MAKAGLTAVLVDKVRRPGKYYDQFGLYLKVERTRRRYWEQRFTVRRRRAPSVSVPIQESPSRPRATWRSSIVESSLQALIQSSTGVAR